MKTKLTTISRISQIPRNKLIPMILMAGFCVIGILALTFSHAATPFLSSEPESGTLSNGATAVNDTTASGGKYVLFGGGTTPPPPPPPSSAAGVYITQAQLARAKTRSGAAAPFGGSYSSQKGRADSALNATPNPFYMEHADYLANIKYGWCENDGNGKDDSLGEARDKLQKDSDLARTLALQYALTGDTRYADKAKAFMLAWANRSTPVNMYDFYTTVTPTFEAQLRGMTTDYCSFRPWNFALDGMFQGYGLVNFSDAYALLTKNGYTIPAADNTNIKGYILDLTEAVNSSFHAWTRWGDSHKTSSSYGRYRGDNHISWGNAYLLAASVALNDQALANYVLAGGTWTDSRAGAYKNPSPIRDVIDRAVLADGRIIDPVQFDRDESYTYFHLWPMQLAAQAAEVNYDQDVWGYKGADGKGIQDAYDYAAGGVISGAFSSDSWQFELAYDHWPTTRNKSARDKTNRQQFILQSYGPVVLLFGE